MNSNYKFINLYAELENKIKEYYGNKTRGSVILFHIDKLKKSYGLKEKQRAKELDGIRTLRNFIIHEADIVNDDAFTINQSVIDFIEQEIKFLTEPLRAIDLCTKIENMNYVGLQSSTKETLYTMISKGFSHIPVLDKNNYLVGVFSANTLLSHIYNNELTEINLNSTINDYFNYLDINYNKDCYRFVASSANIDELIDIFEQKKYQNKRVSMIFVTKGGQIKDKILGIITPYDLIKND